jgi:fumarylacetoacetase
MTRLDETHDAGRRSFVASADGHPNFPIQNLPFGVFSLGDAAPRTGVAIGDSIFDLTAACAAGLFTGEVAEPAKRAAAPPLNGFLALGQEQRRAVRRRLSQLLQHGAAERARVEMLLVDAGEAMMHLPAAIGDYTDFYAGIHHAMNIGRVFRPGAPLLPNYKYVPIGYHGRASSVIPSGTDFRRPKGQREPDGAEAPIFAPTRRLDFETELGMWIGPGNALGDAIPIAQAAEHIAGFCLLNDWSARDIQAWEYRPLGPFLSKDFATSISPWIVTAEALAPFRTAQAARPAGDPPPLPHLFDERDQREGAWDIAIETLILTERMRTAGAGPVRLARSNTRVLYWTPAQLAAHHTSNGCNLRPGDLLGSGTLSGPTRDSFGSLLELSASGPIALPSGESRSYLEDGDEIVLRGQARGDRFVSIGFGDCRARVLPAS